MPTIALVGYATNGIYTTATDFTVALDSLTGGIGSEAQEGDLVIVESGWASVSNGVPGVTTAGYSSICELYSDDTSDANFSVDYKLMGSTPDTTVTVKARGSVDYASAAMVSVWRNCDPGTPLDVAPVTATGNNSARPISPAITPATAGAVVLSLGLGTGDIAPASMTAPSGFTLIRSFPQPSEQYGPVISAALLAWNGSGQVAAAAWTAGEESVGRSWCAVSVALRPASDAPSQSFWGVPF